MLKAWYEQHKTQFKRRYSAGPHEIVNLDTPEGQQTYTEVNKRVLQGGYEGIMIKDNQCSMNAKKKKKSCLVKTETHLLK